MIITILFLILILFIQDSLVNVIVVLSVVPAVITVIVITPQRLSATHLHLGCVRQMWINVLPKYVSAAVGLELGTMRSTVR